MKRILATVIIFYSAAANAQIATIDAGNIVQSSISAEQAVTQTAQQLQQYQAQLQQLQNQIQNTANPGSFQWDNANATINNVLAGVNTLKAFETQAGSITAFLNKYSDATQYGTTCIGTGGCTATQLQQISASQTTGSDSQKTANDNMLLNINAQQQQLQSDANAITVLQQSAQGSAGQMEALQAANQLASNEALQLMQIRALMIAQQTAEAMRAETIVDQEAQQQASRAAFIGTAPATSTPYNILSYAGAAQ